LPSASAVSGRPQDDFISGLPELDVQHVEEIQPTEENGCRFQRGPRHTDREAQMLNLHIHRTKMIGDDGLPNSSALASWSAPAGQPDRLAQRARDHGDISPRIQSELALN
jgi:hypothetical protein